MRKQITVSAPGKLMLFGEHAVVYNRPCIVTAVDQRLKLQLTTLEKPYFELNAPDVGIIDYKKKISDLGKGEIPKGAKFVEIALKNFLKEYPQKTGFKFKTLSDFKSTFGFGSSSASTVCAIKALSEISELNLSNEHSSLSDERSSLSDKEIFDLSYKTVSEIAGVGSGFDLAAAIYGGTIYFLTGGKAIKPLNLKNFSLVVGFTGIKADTPTIVKHLQEKMKKKPDFYNHIFDEIEKLVLLGKNSLVSQNYKRAGEFMNLNQTHLFKIGVSSKKLDGMIDAARKAGAYGAKLSGAGVGDCMIALIPPSKKSTVEKAIQKAGGEVLKVEVNAEGVRIETNKATAIAPSNIAFTKYWGRKDEKLRLPINGSISMTLSNLLTTTTVQFDEKLKKDDITINNEKKELEIGRVIKHLDRIRAIAEMTAFAKVASVNNFPTGTGLSSSSSGFAALTTAASVAAGLDLSEKELSILARQGSGSSCRSIPGGFVEWLDGNTSKTSYAKTIFPKDHWDIADVVAVVSKNRKEVPTSEGHENADSSPFLKIRVERMKSKNEELKKIIKKKDFKKLGEFIEQEALELHSIYMTQNPPLIYLNPNSLLIIKLTKKWRDEGLAVYFTVNTGQDVHLIVEKKNIKKLEDKLKEIPEVKQIIVNEPGDGTRLSDSHLF